MKPGDFYWWVGRELFHNYTLRVSDVFNCEPGLALIVARNSQVVSDGGSSYVETYALIIVNGCLGWTYSNWLNKID